MVNLIVNHLICLLSSEKCVGIRDESACHKLNKRILWATAGGGEWLGSRVKNENQPQYRYLVQSFKMFRFTWRVLIAETRPPCSRGSSGSTLLILIFLNFLYPKGFCASRWEGTEECGNRSARVELWKLNRSCCKDLSPLKGKTNQCWVLREVTLNLLPQSPSGSTGCEPLFRDECRTTRLVGVEEGGADSNSCAENIFQSQMETFGPYKAWILY